MPHFDAEGFTQSITFRLADSLPTDIFETLAFKLRTKQISDVRYYREIDRAMDLGSGSTYLKQPAIAEIVAKAMLNLAGNKYELHSWVIMPNHVHLLIFPLPGHSLSKIVHSVKSFTASKANQLLHKKGQFWSPDYFDRFIRNSKHFSAVKKYIDNNPVKAGLCLAPGEWLWGSAGWRD